MATGWRNPTALSTPYHDSDSSGLDSSSSDPDAAVHQVRPTPSSTDPNRKLLSSYAVYAASEPAPPVSFKRSPPIDCEPHRLQKAFFRFLPIAATVSWLTTVLGLIALWLWVDDRERYKWYLGAVPFISDIGAVHPEWFATGAVWTALFLTASVLAERYLRSTRVLVEATDERHLWIGIGILDCVAVLFSGVALIELSWFDAFDHPDQHNLYLIMFIVGVNVSGALQTAEVEHLWHEHPDRDDLRQSTVLKVAFMVIASSCGVAFWTLYALCDGDASKNPSCYRETTASAVLQWAAAILLGFYMATLCIDLWPAYRHAPVEQPAFANRLGVIGFLPSNPNELEKGSGVQRSVGRSRSRGRRARKHDQA